VFFGLTHATGRADLGRAVLEGVAFALADGRDALLAAGAKLHRIWVIGGGARSLFWGRLLAAVLERPLLYPAGAELGPAFGAARLARLAVLNEEPATVCVSPSVAAHVEAHPDWRERYRRRRERYQRLYQGLRGMFRELEEE
jgi:xylulokinase